jgi:hypothetical protein
MSGSDEVAVTFINPCLLNEVAEGLKALLAKNIGTNTGIRYGAYESPVLAGKDVRAIEPKWQRTYPQRLSAGQIMTVMVYKLRQDCYSPEQQVVHC